MALLPLIRLLLIISVLIHGRSSCAAAAAPLPLAPNMSSCHLPSYLPVDETPFNCCPPSASYSPRLFRPSATQPLRVRRPSHSASPSYAQKLARAYALMKALPPHDPRSFSQQANIHCAYCNSVYNQLNSSQPFQVHHSWLFLPFHRWYIYFHERILAKLLGDDPTFALSFWNYDLPEGASIPWIYSPSFNETLVSSLRSPLHNVPNATVSITSPLTADHWSQDVIERENANAMYRQLIRDASTQRDFFGFPYRQGDSPFPGLGTLEAYPHNTVHIWVGDMSQVGMKDMGSFYAAARDPIFYAHHAQLDRLWEVWKTIPGHEELRENDYLNSEFAFYNEDAELVRVKVGDALNTTLLGYVYEEVEMPWMDAVPTYKSSGPVDLASNFTICTEGEPILEPCSAILQREPNASPWLHERLVVTLEYSGILGAHLDVYLNLPSADASTGTGCNEFLTGIESITLSKFIASDTDRTINGVEISERLADLNLTEQSNVVVTLVPSFPKQTISPNDAMILGECYLDYILPQTQASHPTINLINPLSTTML